MHFELAHRGMGMSTASNWVNIGSAVGVLMGIVFLGWEVRQNTEMMKSQARDAITEKQMMYSEWQQRQLGYNGVASASGLPRILGRR